MFKKILVPVNLTNKDEVSLKIASDLARQNSASITLFHVVEAIDFITEEEEQDFYKKLEKAAQEKMDIYVESLKKQGLSVEEEVVVGKRTKEIIQHAMNSQADLIILYSHKVDINNPTEGWGTISHKVAILAQCPVLLVK